MIQSFQITQSYSRPQNQRSSISSIGVLFHLVPTLNMIDLTGALFSSRFLSLLPVVSVFFASPVSAFVATTNCGYLYRRYIPAGLITHLHANPTRRPYYSTNSVVSHRQRLPLCASGTKTRYCLLAQRTDETSADVATTSSTIRQAAAYLVTLGLPLVLEKALEGSSEAGADDPSMQLDRKKDGDDDQDTVRRKKTTLSIAEKEVPPKKKTTTSSGRSASQVATDSNVPNKPSRWNPRNKNKAQLEPESSDEKGQLLSIPTTADPPPVTTKDTELSSIEKQLVRDSSNEKTTASSSLTDDSTDEIPTSLSARGEEEPRHFSTNPSSSLLQPAIPSVISLGHGKPLATTTTTTNRPSSESKKSTE